MTETPKACPFCNGTHIKIEQTGTMFYATCGTCACEGPVAGTHQWSMTLWNRRDPSREAPTDAR